MDKFKSIFSPTTPDNKSDNSFISAFLKLWYNVTDSFINKFVMNDKKIKVKIVIIDIKTKDLNDLFLIIFSDFSYNGYRI